MNEKESGQMGSWLTKLGMALAVVDAGSEASQWPADSGFPAPKDPLRGYRMTLNPPHP
jgi:hypothetical protein